MEILFDSKDLAEPIFDFNLDEKQSVLHCLEILDLQNVNEKYHDYGMISEEEYRKNDTGYNYMLNDIAAYMKQKGFPYIPGDYIFTPAVVAVSNRKDKLVDARTETELNELRSKWELMDKLKEEDIALERARYTKEISSEVYFQKKEELLDQFMPLYNFCMAHECVDMVKLAGMES